GFSGFLTVVVLGGSLLTMVAPIWGRGISRVRLARAAASWRAGELPRSRIFPGPTTGTRGPTSGVGAAGVEGTPGERGGATAGVGGSGGRTTSGWTGAGGSATGVWAAG